MANITDDRGYNQVWAMNEATRVRAERRCDYMISRMQMEGGGKVMEIGCGLGSNSYMLASKTKAEVLGTDLCAPFIDEARAKYKLPNLRFEALNFNHPDRFDGEMFDCIVGNGILHHLYHHLDQALSNMKRLLKPGGKIVFLEPNIYNPYIYLIFRYPVFRKFARLEPEEMAFSRHFITGALARAGYQNIDVTYQDFLLPGIPAFLIRPSILLGGALERIPGVRLLAQSIFIFAEKQPAA